MFEAPAEALHQIHDFGLPRLGNATADARDIGQALETAGFETTVKKDVKRRELYQLIDAFAARIASGEILVPTKR